MKYKTAFRLAVRAIGLLVIAQSLPWLIVSCGGFALRLVFSGWSGPLGGSMWDWELRIGITYLVATLAGAYLFFRGGWIVDRAIPSNRPYCHECAYELTGLPAEGACPECGTPFRHGTPPARPIDRA